MIDNSFLKAELNSERLHLKAVHPSLIKEVERYFMRNRDHFEPSMPDLPLNFYTGRYQLEKIWYEYDNLVNSHGCRYYIFRKGDSTSKFIVGDISISEIVRSTASSCTIGYKVDKEHLRKGYMFEALSCLLADFFDSLNFHRITVQILPENIPSLALATKLGFVEEGTSRSLIKIKGQWRDHLRMAIINPKHI